MSSGWSNPCFAANSARCSGVADSGRYRLVGSPVRRASRNTPSSTMINGSALVYVRRRMKENMGAGLPYLLRDRGGGRVGGCHLGQPHLVTGGGIGGVVDAGRLAEDALHVGDVGHLHDLLRFLGEELGERI